MKSIVLGRSGLESSRLVYGCMRICGDNTLADRDKGKEAVRAAIDAGYTHFDHADIYGGGSSEAVFCEVLRESPGLREKLVVTSKCGIVQPEESGGSFTKRYDFSREYILTSVEGSLRRLGIDHLDLLLLHRPDFLMDAKQVAATFEMLKEQGKVRYFGVSNFQPSQLSLLQAHCSVPLVVNQIEVNIDNVSAIVDGTLDQCQELNIAPMAWCPLGGVAYSAWGGTLNDQQSERIRHELIVQSEKYAAEPWIVILAWLLRHPAGILPIVGSTTPSRIRAATSALDINYTRVDWYRLWQARNGHEVS
jgi:predicted oxidoreductase